MAVRCQTMVSVLTILACVVLLPPSVSPIEFTDVAAPNTTLFMNLDVFEDEAFDLLNALDPIVPLPYPITNWCYAWLHQFAVVASEFIECSVKHARPFRFCRNCLKQYLSAHNFISDLISQDKKLDIERRCFPKLIDSDVINIVGKVRDFMENVWKDSACDRCFEHYEFENGTIDAELTNFTKAYIAQYNITDKCINSYIQYKNGTKQYDQLACEKCYADYVALNNMYNLADANDSVCMDVEDAMNYTRYLWSKDFQCNISDPNEAVVYGTCTVIFTLPIFFYLISVFQGTVQKKRLMKMKRLNLRRGTPHARLLQSASLVYSDQVHHISRRTSVVDVEDARRMNITPMAEAEADVHTTAERDDSPI